MKKKDKLVRKILEKLCLEMGFGFIMHPENFVGQIAFPNGNKVFFKNSLLWVNSVSASKVADDKDYAHFFMQSMGYSIIKGKKFYSDKWASAIGSDQDKTKALEYARKVGFPLIVKPNSGSQGRGVARVDSEEDFKRAVDIVLDMDRIVLVQELVHGKDFRVVVMDNKIISAYERIPLNVTGNGKSTIKELILLKQENFEKIGRDTKINIEDPRILETLKLQGLDFDSIVPDSKNVRLLTNANLSSGGDAMDVTDFIHPSIKELCSRLTRDMGLRLCGVDLMINYEIDEELKDYVVIEINAAP